MQRRIEITSNRLYCNFKRLKICKYVQLDLTEFGPPMKLKQMVKFTCVISKLLQPKPSSRVFATGPAGYNEMAEQMTLAILYIPIKQAVKNASPNCNSLYQVYWTTVHMDPHCGYKY